MIYGQNIIRSKTPSFSYLFIFYISYQTDLRKIGKNHHRIEPGRARTKQEALKIKKLRFSKMLRNVMRAKPKILNMD
jgi:hypothetical protein